jgi:hypothetical protein
LTLHVDIAGECSRPEYLPNQVGKLDGLLPNIKLLEAPVHNKASQAGTVIPITTIWVQFPHSPF